MKMLIFFTKINFQFSQVSFFSTSPELSNKQRFEYFSRTIPSDHYQVKAMVDIVRRMGWSYISIIYEESNYGIKVRYELFVKYFSCLCFICAPYVVRKTLSLTQTEWMPDSVCILCLKYFQILELETFSYGVNYVQN